MKYIFINCLLLEKIKSHIISDYPKLILNQEALMWGIFADDFISCQKINEFNSMRSVYDFEGKKNEIIDFICNYANNRNDSFFLNYAIGFLAHYSLYSNSNDFFKYKVNEFLKISESNDNVQAEIEVKKALDTIILRDQAEKVPNDIKLKKLLSKDNNIINDISKMYSMLFSEVFSVTILEREVKSEILKFRKKISRVNDSTGIKAYIVNKIENIFNLNHYKSSSYYSILEDDTIDYFNINNEQWTDGNNNVSNKSFSEIFDDTVINSKKLIYLLVSGNQVSKFIDVM